jgi:hypothetical protein
MRRSAIPSRLLAVAFTAALLLPAGASAQLREVVSKQISVGASEAALVLEFTGGERLDAAFRNGTVSVDGRSLGSYEVGGPLDSAWRALLGQAVALENGPLAVAVSDWSVPASLAGSALDVGQALERALTEALEPASPAEAPGVSVSVGQSEGSTLARLLVGSVTRLSVIEDALRGLGPNIMVHVQEDFEVAAGEVVEGTVVLIDGTARIEGEIRGDLVVVDGSVALEEGSVVTGELRMADARMLRNLGSVSGGVVDVLATERSETDDLRERLRSEIRDEIRRDLRNEIRDVTRSSSNGFSFLSPFRSVVRGVGGLIETVFTILVLGLLGAVAVSFARENIEIVADAAREAPGRAATVGLAGTFLLLPIWILGAVALVISIVGIPVAIAWLPLFPAAVLVAGLFGYLAVAKNAGEWLADSGYAWTDWIRKSNPVHAIVGGLVGLMLAFAAAHVLSILPFFGFLSGLLVFVGCVITFAAVQIGFGAVLLTRGGRRREHWTMDPEEAWAAAMDIDTDLEDDIATAAGSTGGGAGSNDPDDGSERHV